MILIKKCLFKIATVAKVGSGNLRESLRNFQEVSSKLSTGRISLQSHLSAAGEGGRRKGKDGWQRLFFRQGFSNCLRLFSWRFMKCKCVGDPSVISPSASQMLLTTWEMSQFGINVKPFKEQLFLFCAIFKITIAQRKKKQQKNRQKSGGNTQTLTVL